MNDYKMYRTKAMHSRIQFGLVYYAQCRYLGIRLRSSLVDYLLTLVGVVLLFQPIITQTYEYFQLEVLKIHYKLF
jgi:hypothetical protein